MRYQGKKQPYTKEKPSASPIRYHMPSTEEWLHRYRVCCDAGLRLAAAYCFRRYLGEPE